MPLSEVTKLIQGKAGTKVTLTVKRDQQTLSFELTREVIQTDSVEKPKSTISIPDNIGYISINVFAEDTGSEFTTVLNQVLSKKPKGLILDLRDNGGGYVDSALSVLDHFVAKDKVLVNMKMNGNTVGENSMGPGDIHLPMIILTNGNTASAAELVAGALQDYKIAKLIGTKTYGKGVAQNVITFSDRSILKITIENWLTPLGNDINKVGLKPDIEVDLTKDDVKNGKDPQLERAIEELGK